MDVYADRLNVLLVDTFRHILKMEERMLKSMGDMRLTISEVHLIEAVGKDGRKPKTISKLAESLEVSLPFVTNAVKKLEQSGHVIKTKSEEDGRSVLIALTRLGEKVDNAHTYFHRKMTAAVAEGMSDHEKSSVIQGLEKLDNFFKGKIDNHK